MAHPPAPPLQVLQDKARAAPRVDAATVLRELIPVVLHETASRIELFPARLASLLKGAPQEEGLLGASRLLQRNDAGFRRLWLTSLRDSLLRGAEQLLLRTQGTDPPSAPIDLSLTTFEAMESCVLIEALARTLTAAHADRLRHIDAGLARLAPARAVSSPFQPLIFLHAFADAWRHFDTTGAPFHRLMRKLTPELFPDLGPIFDRIVDALPASSAGGDDIAESGFGAPLRRWLTVSDSVTHIARVRQLLRDMFDGFFLAQPGKEAVRTALLQLELPLLNIALGDVDFFLRDDHPARRLLARVAQAAAAASDSRDPDDPHCRALESIVPRLLQDPAHAASLCGDIAHELAELIAGQERKLIARLAPAIAEARRQEKIVHAKALAEQDVALRLESGEAVNFVSLFLETQWTRVLGLAYSMHDTRPDAARNARDTMDNLIRSVKPGASLRERKELVERLPGLLASLTGWLNLVKWQGAERDAFFAQLAAHHAMLVRSNNELTARDQLQINIDMLQRASERRLNTRILEQQEAADDFDHLADQAQAGMWAWFGGAGGPMRHCKLHWVGPLRRRFVFSHGRGEKVFTLSFDEFARALRHGQARISIPETAFDLALFHALDSILL